jgi:hypothetical protein
MAENILKNKTCGLELFRVPDSKFRVSGFGFKVLGSKV